MKSVGFKSFSEVCENDIPETKSNNKNIKLLNDKNLFIDVLIKVFFGIAK